MTQSISAKILRTLPPISTISVNKNNVVFTDSESKKMMKFSNKKETKVFLSWLLSLSSESTYRVL